MNKLPPSKYTRRYEAHPGFCRFWDVYPNKRGSKIKALETWIADDLEGYADGIVEDVENRTANHWVWRKDGGKYIPMAASYLNGEKWNEEIEAPPTKRESRPHTQAEWLGWGASVGLTAQRGESMEAYLMRLQREYQEVRRH